MKIIIATGIYPPEIGGPAEYARQMYETLSIQGHSVEVVTYGALKSFPTGIRHILYFVKLLLEAISADYIIALDTFSVALPAVIFSSIFGNKVVIRVGGDFLWESYVERTKEKILLSEFYTQKRRYTIKENIIFHSTSFALRKSDGVVFSTEWQRDIMSVAYTLHSNKLHIIENFYSSERIIKEKDFSKKIFLSPSRDIVIKNKETLGLAFENISIKHPDVFLDTKVVSHEVLIEKISGAYAVIVASLSEVSPNLIIESLEYAVPVIVTQDVGIANRLEGIALFVDPLSTHSIEDAVETLLVPEKYDALRRRISLYTFSHSWNEIAQEFIDVYNNLR